MSGLTLEKQLIVSCVRCCIAVYILIRVKCPKQAINQCDCIEYKSYIYIPSMGRRLSSVASDWPDTSPKYTPQSTNIIIIITVCICMANAHACTQSQSNGRLCYMGRSCMYTYIYHTVYKTCVYTESVHGPPSPVV